MRRRIGINAVFLDPRRTGGAETYTRELLAAMQQLDTDDDVVLFVPQNAEPPVTNERFEIVRCPVDPANRWKRIAWEHWALPGLMRQHRLDLVHFPYGLLPFCFRGRAVVTVHDTVRFFAPEEMPWLQRVHRGIVERRIGDSGQHVIAVSRSDGENIARHLPMPAERIFPVYHGVSERWFGEPPGVSRRRIATPQTLTLPGPGRPQKHTTAGDYLLWIGRPYPTKNLDVLIEAYALLRSRNEDVPPLRLIGIEPQHEWRLQGMLHSHRLLDAVSLERPVSHDSLPALVQAADMLIYPSRLESFGLPVLEAMACGTPVVCADIPVFRELHGENVVYASPFSPEEFARSIERLLQQPALRRQLAQRGREHARRFTWKACAKATWAVFQHLLEGAPQPRDDISLRAMSQEVPDERFPRRA